MQTERNNKKLISVIGAAGQQGGAVVRALPAAGQCKVRALGRNRRQTSRTRPNYCPNQLSRNAILPRLASLL
jgi:uncharacterized protein YbjT (DUF2867 family)